MCNHMKVARPSPQTNRVVALVEILSARPNESLTLAELTRRLGVNKSTCYSMLQALTEVGWLLRDPFHKTYRLGPALVAVGRAASSGFPALDFVRPAMIELSRGVGSHCVALSVAPEHVTVVDQVFPFEGTAQAHALMAANGHSGKMVINVQAAASVRAGNERAAGEVPAGAPA